MSDTRSMRLFKTAKLPEVYQNLICMAFELVVMQVHYLALRNDIPQIPMLNLRNAFFRNVAPGVKALLPGGLFRTPGSI